MRKSPSLFLHLFAFCRQRLLSSACLMSDRTLFSSRTPASAFTSPRMDSISPSLGWARTTISYQRSRRTAARTFGRLECWSCLQGDSTPKHKAVTSTLKCSRPTVRTCHLPRLIDVKDAIWFLERKRLAWLQRSLVPQRTARCFESKERRWPGWKCSIFGSYRHVRVTIVFSVTERTKHTGRPEHSRFCVHFP